jgi:hypothetical protein
LKDIFVDLIKIKNRKKEVASARTYFCLSWLNALKDIVS